MAGILFVYPLLLSASDIIQGPVPEMRQSAWSLPDLSTFLFFVEFLCCAFLALSPFVRKWTRRYSLVLVYIFVRIASELSLWLAVWYFGLTSIRYTYSYVFLSTILIGFAIAVLLSIYTVLGGFNLPRDWPLPVGSICVALLGLLDQRPIWPLFRMLDILYTVLTFLGAATLVRMIRKRESVDLGWNLKLVLLALTVPAAFYSLVFAAYTMGMGLSYENAADWIHGTALASWIILVAAMMDYSPPRNIERFSAGSERAIRGDTTTPSN